jgi:hypothetical protein
MRDGRHFNAFLENIGAFVAYVEDFGAGDHSSTRSCFSGSDYFR